MLQNFLYGTIVSKCFIYTNDLATRLSGVALPQFCIWKQRSKVDELSNSFWILEVFKIVFLTYFCFECLH